MSTRQKQIGIPPTVKMLLWLLISFSIVSNVGSQGMVSNPGGNVTINLVGLPTQFGQVDNVNLLGAYSNALSSLALGSSSFIATSDDGSFTQGMLEPSTVTLAAKFIGRSSQDILSGNFHAAPNFLSQSQAPELAREYEQLPKLQQDALQGFFAGSTFFLKPEQDRIKAFGYGQQKIPFQARENRWPLQALLPAIDFPLLSDPLRLQSIVNEAWSLRSTPERQLVVWIHEYELNASLEFFTYSENKKIFLHPKDELFHSGSWGKINAKAKKLFETKANVLVITENSKHVEYLNQAFPATFFIPSSQSNLAKTLENKRTLSEMPALTPLNTEIINGLPTTRQEIKNVFAGTRLEKTLNPRKASVIREAYRGVTQDNLFQEVEKSIFGESKAELVRVALKNPTKNTIIVVGHCTGSVIIFEDGSKIHKDEFVALANDKLHNNKLVILFACHGRDFLSDYWGARIAPYSYILAGYEEALSIYSKFLRISKGQNNMFDFLVETFRRTRLLGPWAKKTIDEMILESSLVSNYDNLRRK